MDMSHTFLLHYKFINKYIYCTEVYIYCIYSTRIRYSSVYPPVVQSCTMQDEVFNPVSPGNTVLNGNFVFDLRKIFQEGNPGIKRDLPIQITMNNGHYKCKDMDALDIVTLICLLYIVSMIMVTYC